MANNTNSLATKIAERLEAEDFAYPLEARYRIINDLVTIARKLELAAARLAALSIQEVIDTYDEPSFTSVDAEEPAVHERLRVRRTARLSAR